MKRPLQVGAAIVCASTLMAISALAAETETWPWIDKTPPNLALATLPKIDSVTAAIDDIDPPTVTVSVKAKAPTTGFSELQLTPVLGDPDDEIFTFEAKGRPPQDVTPQVLTPVTVTGKYKDAPVAKVAVVEVRGVDNCKAYSIKDKKEVACTTADIPSTTPPQ